MTCAARRQVAHVDVNMAYKDVSTPLVEATLCGLHVAPMDSCHLNDSKLASSSSSHCLMPAGEYCRVDDDTSTSKWAWNYPIGDVDNPLCETGPTIVKISAGRGDLAGLASIMGQSCESEHDRRVAAFRPDHQQKLETLACGSCQNPFGSIGRFVRGIKPLIHGGRCRGRWAGHTQVSRSLRRSAGEAFRQMPSSSYTKESGHILFRW
jgi:hypothetical protein